MLTKAAYETKLSNQGVPIDIIEDLLKATAQDRHKHRVKITCDAAYEAASQFTEDKETWGFFLILLDLVGEGGTMGLTGDATTRLECFRHLGKGRKNASDGPAYVEAAWNCLFFEKEYRTVNFMATEELDVFAFSFTEGGVWHFINVVELPRWAFTQFKNLLRLLFLHAEGKHIRTDFRINSNLNLEFLTELYKTVMRMEQALMVC